MKKIFDSIKNILSKIRAVVINNYAKSADKNAPKIKNNEEDKVRMIIGDELKPYSNYLNHIFGNEANTCSELFGIEKWEDTKNGNKIISDDLVKIEGIGLNIAEIIKSKGVTTFAQLADTEPELIKTWLDEAGPAYKVHDPGTWPMQSGLAAEGKWDELKTWQDEHKGGKA